MKQAVDTVLALDGPAFCEIFTDTKQVWEPKSSTKRLPDLTSFLERWQKEIMQFHQTWKINIPEILLDFSWQCVR